jgi:hypothetical protein
MNTDIIIIIILILCFISFMIPNIEGHALLPNTALNEHLDANGNEISPDGDGLLILEHLSAEDIGNLFDVAVEVREHGLAGGIEAAMQWGLSAQAGNVDAGPATGMINFISGDHACTPSYAAGCKVSLEDNPTLNSHTGDLLNRGIISFAEYSMVPEMYIVNNSSVCGSGNHCGDDGKPHADVIQFMLTASEKRFDDKLNVWKEHHDVCYKDWAIACDNAGWACKPYIDGVAIDDPENHEYTNPGDFKCYHRSVGAGWLAPGSARCDEYTTGCPYEFQCRTYSDKFPSECEGHLSKDDSGDEAHFGRAAAQTQEALCNTNDNNERGCINFNDDRESNDMREHNQVHHSHKCMYDQNNQKCCRRPYDSSSWPYGVCH